MQPAPVSPHCSVMLQLGGKEPGLLCHIFFVDDNNDGLVVSNSVFLSTMVSFKLRLLFFESGIN